MKVLVVDARDSFVHVLADYVARRPDVEVVVVRPDKVGVEPAVREATDSRTDAVVLGPGPGHPSQSCHVPVALATMDTKPVLGVCLGHQVLGLLAGASIEQLDRPRHGYVSRVVHDGSGVFAGLPAEARVARYHSLAVDPATAGPSLRVVANAADDGVVMGLEVGALAVGVQFHPESHGSHDGHRIVSNFLDSVAGSARPGFTSSFSTLRVTETDVRA
ncbi:MAG: anthranilate synthase component II [Pseudonocardiaceae bacterium]